MDQPSDPHSPGGDAQDERDRDRKDDDLDPEPLEATIADVPRAFPSGETDEAPPETGAVP